MEVKKSTLRNICICIIVTIFVAILGYWGLSDSENQDQNQDYSQRGIYEYSEDKLDEVVANNDRTLLFIGADWCAGCEVFENDLKASTEDIPEDVAFVLADYDDDKDLVERYDVKINHTFIEVNKDKEKVKDYVGGYSLEEVMEEFKI